MKSFSFLLCLLAGLSFFAVGCGATDSEKLTPTTPPQKEATKSATSEIQKEPLSPNEAMNMDENPTHVMFTAKALEDQKAQFSWEIPEEFSKQAEKYVVIRSTDKEPVYPASWWWWRGPSFNELTWEDLPTGKAYFRLCVLKEETCVAYSNSIELDIQ